MRTKKTKKRFLHFWQWLQKQLTQGTLIWKGKRNCWIVYEIFKTEGIQTYSTMCETMTAFAERTIRSLTYYRRIWTHVLSQIVSFSTNPELLRKMLNRLDTKKYKEFWFFVRSVQHALWGYCKPKFEIGDRVGILMYDLHFKKGYKPQHTPESFEFIAISARKPPTYATKYYQKENIRDEFNQKKLLNVIWQCNR